jgi:hypothetical protein
MAGHFAVEAAAKADCVLWGCVVNHAAHVVVHAVDLHAGKTLDPGNIHAACTGLNCLLRGSWVAADTVHRCDELPLVQMES